MNEMNEFQIVLIFIAKPFFFNARATSYMNSTNLMILLSSIISKLSSELKEHLTVCAKNATLCTDGQMLF